MSNVFELPVIATLVPPELTVAVAGNVKTTLSPLAMSVAVVKVIVVVPGDADCAQVPSLNLAAYTRGTIKKRETIRAVKAGTLLFIL